MRPFSKTAKTTATILGLAGALIGGAALRNHIPAARAGETIAPRPTTSAARVQIALLLDTSNSMDGLIDQARSQLWRVVNELAAAKKAGNAPAVELALYEYGKQTVPEADGFVRRVVPFTTDLDRVSEALFALTTNGGEEYCGRAIAEATKGLEWSANADDLKLIFIAGNEPFDQGVVDWHDSVRAAKARGIVVNVVHAGAEEERGWRDAARLGGGELVMINQDQKIVAISAPQDADIERLSVALNATYLPYGVTGAASAERQQAQDSNAVTVRQGATVQRALSKASAAYNNAAWDLVDARAGGFDLGSLSPAELPPALRRLSGDEVRAKVDEAGRERSALKAQIQKLDGERRAYVAAAEKTLGKSDSTFDAAIVAAVKAQATQKGFRFQ